MKLYELEQNYLNLLDLLEDENIPPEMVQAALKEVEGDIENKAENITKLIKNTEADIKALKEEETKLYNKRKSLENKKASLKMYLESTLKAIGKQKIKGGIFTLSLQKNPPKLIIDDLSVIHPRYIIERKIEEVDKKNLKEDLQKGIKITGVKLEYTESLRIK